MSAKLAADAVKPDLLRKYEKDSEDAKLLNEATGKLRDCEVQADNPSCKIPEIELALQKIELDIQKGAKRISEAEKRVKELK